MVTTIAGTTDEGFMDGNSLTEAKFNSPYALVMDNDIIDNDRNTLIISK